MPFAVWIYASINKLIFNDIIDRNPFRIKEKLLFLTLKIWKKKRGLFFIRKAYFNKELPEIQKSFSTIKNNKKEAADLIKQCDIDLLTETYIEMILNDKIEDNKCFILNLLIMELSDTSIAKIKKYKSNKIQMENVLEY